MNTRNVTISPAVALEEERALTASLRNRNLILAQAVADLREQLAEINDQIRIGAEKKEDADGTADNL